MSPCQPPKNRLGEFFRKYNLTPIKKSPGKCLCYVKCKFFHNYYELLVIEKYMLGGVRLVFRPCIESDLTQQILRRNDITRIYDEKLSELGNLGIEAENDDVMIINTPARDAVVTISEDEDGGADVRNMRFELKNNDHILPTNSLAKNNEVKVNDDSNVTADVEVKNGEVGKVGFKVAGDVEVVTTNSRTENEVVTVNDDDTAVGQIKKNEVGNVNFKVKDNENVMATNSLAKTDVVTVNDGNNDITDDAVKNYEVGALYDVVGAILDDVDLDSLQSDDLEDY